MRLVRFQRAEDTGSYDDSVTINVDSVVSIDLDTDRHDDLQGMTRIRLLDGSLYHVTNMIDEVEQMVMSAPMRAITTCPACE